MTVSFQVGDREFGGSGSLEVDFWVSCLAVSLYTQGGTACVEGLFGGSDCVLSE